jgi:hypothetical protein
LAVAGAACLLAAHMPAQSSQAAPIPPAADDNARFLAGMMPYTDPAAIALAEESAWQRHAGFFDTAWAALEKNQLSKVRDWARAGIPDAFAAKGSVFYMFSGPDFLYADTFFPNAETYVLCGIEPVGPLPDVSKLEADVLGGELRALQESLNSVLNLSFFITKDMKNDLRHHALNGTLPILYIFLARSGKTLSEVSHVSLDTQGVLTVQADGTNAAKSSAPGVRIRFRTKDSDTLRTLYYFSTDISNSGLKQSGFLQFCKTLAPANGCVKSASYLMHDSYFSSIREFLLDNTTTLVQDDSGIPCSHFAPEAWQMKFFGSYQGPIPLFKDCYQPMLAEFYRTAHPEPLPFGIGYRHRAGTSTLMVATRMTPVGKEKTPEAAAAVSAPRAVVVPQNESATPQ